jgi:hypothetical protein
MLVAVATNIIGDTKMKAEEHQYCYTNRLCFYCKALGHDVENYEKKRMADTQQALSQMDYG